MMGAFFRVALLSVAVSALSQLALAQDADPLPWSVQLAAEVGVGMRDIRLPRDNVIYEISTGVYPALGVGFGLSHHSSERFSVGLMARYQSSLGLVLDEQLTGGTPHRRNTRSHLFEVGVAPSLHWKESGWALSGMIGFSVSELDPLNHLATPSYHLGGPHARIAVRIPLGSERFGLNVGGEGQLTLLVGDELRMRGVSAQGFGAGVNAALEARLGAHWGIAVTYRELRYGLGTQQGPGFTDAARFITAQLRGTL